MLSVGCQGQADVDPKTVVESGAEEDCHAFDPVRAGFERAYRTEQHSESTRFLATREHPFLNSEANN